MSLLATIATVTETPLAQSLASSAATSFIGNYIGRTLSSLVGDVFGSLGISNLFGSQGGTVVNNTLSTITTQIGSAGLKFNDINYEPFVNEIEANSTTLGAKTRDIMDAFSGGRISLREGRLNDALQSFELAKAKTQELTSIANAEFSKGEISEDFKNSMLETSNSAVATIRDNNARIATFQTNTKNQALQVAQQTVQQAGQSLLSGQAIASIPTPSVAPTAAFDPTPILQLQADIARLLGDTVGDVGGLKLGLENFGDLTKLGTAGLAGLSAILGGNISNLDERVGALESPSVAGLITARRPELHKAIFKRIETETAPDTEPITPSSVELPESGFEGLAPLLEEQTKLASGRRSALDTAIARLTGNPLEGTEESSLERAIARRLGTQTKRVRPRVQKTRPGMAFNL